MSRETGATMNTDESVFVSTYVVAPEHSQVEGHKLQGDDTEDALETVHRLGQLDGLVRLPAHLRVATATQDDGTPLGGEELGWGGGGGRGGERGEEGKGTRGWGGAPV